MAGVPGSRRQAAGLRVVMHVVFYSTPHAHTGGPGGRSPLVMDTSPWWSSTLCVEFLERGGCLPVRVCFGAEVIAEELSSEALPVVALVGGGASLDLFFCSLSLTSGAFAVKCPGIAWGYMKKHRSLPRKTLFSCGAYELS